MPATGDWSCAQWLWQLSFFGHPVVSDTRETKRGKQDHQDKRDIWDERGKAKVKRVTSKRRKTMPPDILIIYSFFMFSVKCGLKLVAIILQIWKRIMRRICLTPPEAGPEIQSKKSDELMKSAPEFDEYLIEEFYSVYSLGWSIDFYSFRIWFMFSA